jgi:hypothetical protein
MQMTLTEWRNNMSVDIAQLVLEMLCSTNKVLSKAYSEQVSPFTPEELAPFIASQPVERKYVYPDRMVFLDHATGEDVVISRDEWRD